MSLGVNEEHIIDWTDTSAEKIPVKYMFLSTWNNVRGAVQLRNIRNPDTPTELCVNNLGSFKGRRLIKRIMFKALWKLYHSLF